MNIPDLNEALSVAPHFDFILFDACYMQSVEVVYHYVIELIILLVLRQKYQVPGPL